MSNALSQESSPYLRQHADNPVDWLPWSQQALELARVKNKPILLSIGYSACHWCHVMAHESFENPETARLMNENFINIKVDREERPDIDKIYQTAHQLMVQRPGGWPLTMFLSPQDQLPFFGGTYFPDTPKHGMMSFNELLQRIISIYQDEPQKIRQQTASMQQALATLSMQSNINQNKARIEALAKFDQQLLQIFDNQDGGFGDAPKFPQAAILLQAIRRAYNGAESEDSYRAIDFSLQKIARGGIQDHLVGGFFRYSVDSKWMIPHFEKMLYDNGQLLCVFALMYNLTRNPLYDSAICGIINWLNTEMISASGSYYAALDADSEGVEGKFYVWTTEQVKVLLDSTAYTHFSIQFGLDQPANFEGKWHLHQFHTVAEIAGRLRIGQEEIESQINAAKLVLVSERQNRIRPGLDNKILTAWNAQVIQGLALSARVFDSPEYYKLAKTCLQALQAECWIEGRLLALSSNSGKQLPAYLDDYALLLQATIDCLQFEWHSADLTFAKSLAEQLLEYFEDQQHGGFYFTAEDHENLIQRPKTWQDEAMPCGNAVAAHAINRLGLLTGEPRYARSAEKALQSVADNVNQNPLYAPGFLGLLADIESPPCLVIIRGQFKALNKWRSRISPILKPSQLVFYIPDNATGLPDSIAGKKSAETNIAWLCRGFSCLPPISNLEELISELSSEHAKPYDRN